MDKKEKLLLSKVLEEAAEQFSTHGCHDMDIEFLKDWSNEELKEFNHKMNVHNGTSDISDDQYVIDAYNYDYWVMNYFSDLLKKESINE